MKKLMLIISLAIALFALDVKKSYLDSYNYEKIGDYKDAIRVLIPLYNKYPNGYTINLRLGWLFYLNKNYENSIKHYQKASLILPYSIEPKLGLMRVYLIIEKYNKILNIGDVILKVDYYNYYANYYIIEALIQKKEYKTALKITNKMLALYPTSVLFLVELGKIYNVLDKIKANKIFNNVLILDPNNIIAKKYLNK